MFPDIPVEIFTRILSFIDNFKTLSSLCLLNKTISPHSQQFLYHSVVLNDDDITPLLDILITSRHLASLVKCLTISGSACGYIDYSNPSRPLSGNSVRNHLGQIQTLLTVLPRLTHLELRYGPHGPWVLPQKQNCPFRLQSFHHCFKYDPNVIHFLEFQSHLTEMVAENLRSEEASGVMLRDTALPKLAVLTAPCSLVDSIIVGRPVHTVCAIVDLTPPTRLKDSAALYGVQRLHINVQTFALIFGGVLSQSCPHLLRLEVTGLIFEKDPNELERLAHQIEDTLEALKHSLCSFVLRVSVFHWDGLPPERLRSMSTADRVLGSRSNLTAMAVKAIAAAGPALTHYHVGIKSEATALYARTRLDGRNEWVDSTTW